MKAQSAAMLARPIRRMGARDASRAVDAEASTEILQAVADTDPRQGVRNRALAALARAGMQRPERPKLVDLPTVNRAPESAIADARVALEQATRVLQRLTTDSEGEWEMMKLIADPRQCTQCGHVGPVGPDFGFRRLANGEIRSVSWCKPCMHGRG